MGRVSVRGYNIQFKVFVVFFYPVGDLSECTDSCGLVSQTVGT